MLNDSETASPAVRRNHRTYMTEFKAELVAVCRRPGASIAAVTTLHGINVKALQRWIKENRLSGSHRLTAQPSPHSPGLPAFVPLPMPASLSIPLSGPRLVEPAQQSPQTTASRSAHAGRDLADVHRMASWTAAVLK